MDSRRRALAIIVLIVAIFSIIGLCVHAATEQKSTSASTSNGGVVFLEHNLIANGTVVNGTVPFRSVNFPSYWFNENTRELNGNVDFAIDSRLLLVFGDVLTLRGNFGAGTGNKLYGVYNLPAQADKATIYYADRYGTVGLYVNNRSVILRPGQEYSYNETETVSDGNGTVRISYQQLYTNHGTIPMTGIQTKMVA